MKTIIDENKLMSFMEWHRKIFRRQHTDPQGDEFISWAYLTLQRIVENPFHDLLHAIPCPNCGKDYFIKKSDVSDAYLLNANLVCPFCHKPLIPYANNILKLI